MIFIFSDIKPRGGGTFGALDSIGVVARFLAQHPEGVNSSGFKTLASECHDFIEWTGNAGDLVLMHPYMLHAVSQNHSGIPRFIINPALSLAEPMNFNRANRDDYSPVELAVLKGLESTGYDFQPTTPRRIIVPAQAEEQKRLREEEKLALARINERFRFSSSIYFKPHAHDHLHPYRQPPGAITFNEPRRQIERSLFRGPAARAGRSRMAPAG